LCCPILFVNIKKIILIIKIKIEEECYDPKKEYYQKVKERLDKTHYGKCGK
jgi:hypothetical protein